jgi:hypothetical protein
VALSFLFSPHIAALMMLQVARLFGFEVLTVAARKSSTFQDITPCSLIKSSSISEEHTAPACCLLNAGFLSGSLSDPEDGDDMFFRILLDYNWTTQHYGPEEGTLLYSTEW